MAFNKSTKATKSKISYEVLEDYEIPNSAKRNGYTLRLRYMKWNDGDEVYDIRPWKAEETGEKCLKGITLSGETLEGLYETLKGIAEK